MGFEEEFENKKSILNFNSEAWFVESPVEKKKRPAPVKPKNSVQNVTINSVINTNRTNYNAQQQVFASTQRTRVSGNSVGTPPPPQYINHIPNQPPKKKSKAPVIIAIVASVVVVFIGLGVWAGTSLLGDIFGGNSSETVTEDITATLPPITEEYITEETTVPLQNGSTVVLGSYPQSKVTDTNLIYQLNSLASYWISYNYFVGSGEMGTEYLSDCMTYCDVTYNGEKYRGVAIRSYRPYYGYLPSNSDNSLQDEHGYYSGNVYWFKYEPLQWTIVNIQQGILVCDTIIDTQPYLNSYYQSSLDGMYYGDASLTIFANDYFNSDIYPWLNNDFYNTAFSYDEKSRIYDKVTIPKDYDYSYDLGKKGASAYANCLGLWYTESGPSVMTWTSGNATNLICAVNCHSDGAHSLDYEKDVCDTTTGICPVILVNNLS